MATKRTFKKKKLAGGTKVFRPWKEWEDGDTIIGTYHSTAVDDYEKNTRFVEVQEAVLADKKLAKNIVGKVLGLNGTNTIESAFKNLEEGTLVQVYYKGIEEMTGGKYKGKDKHVIEVDQLTEEGADEEEESDEDEEDFDL